MPPSVTPMKLVSVQDPVQQPRNHTECQTALRPMHQILGQIGGKWTILIISALSNGPQRFSELKRTIEGISQKMLTATLRDLERDGFISRTVTPTIPPRVDYELTELGEDLHTPIRAIGTWAQLNEHRVEEARARFAARAAEEKRLGW